MLKNATSLTTCVGLTLAVLVLNSAPLQGATLTGSGTHLPIPGPNPGDPGGVSLTQTPWAVGVGFDAVWSSPAHPDWIGTLSATGPIPGALSTGITDYDFSTLPNGNLPAGTIFIVGDLDGGSTLAENIDLTAYDAFSNVISLWLDEPIGIWGAPWPAGSLSVPGWDWNTTTPNAYNFSGATVTGGNPSINVAMLSNTAITRLLINKHATHFGFGMRAPETVPVPVPEPTTAAMLASASCIVLIWRRKRR